VASVARLRAAVGAQPSRAVAEIIAAPRPPAARQGIEIGE